MDIIRNIFTQTPWWVFILFIYLMFIGFKASKGGVVPLGKLIVMPAIFLIMSIDTLITSFTVTFFLVCIWFFSVLIGAGLGWLSIHRTTMKVDKNKKLFEVPGTWSVAIVILLIFATKYYFGYQLGVDPALANHTAFEVTMLFFSGLFSGLFIGKLLNYLYRLKTAEHTDLNE